MSDQDNTDICRIAAQHLMRDLRELVTDLDRFLAIENAFRTFEKHLQQKNAREYAAEIFREELGKALKEDK